MGNSGEKPPNFVKSRNNLNFKFETTSFTVGKLLISTENPPFVTEKLPSVMEKPFFGKFRRSYFSNLEKTNFGERPP
jgi:hypothetical protein